MRVIVPFGAREPKTRLADVLGPDERAAFARAMLDDVLAAIRATGHEPTVLANVSPTEWPGERPDADATVDERPLTAAVNAVLESVDGPVAVVMADLALATGEALSTLFEASGDVVVVPGRGGGTNALVTREPAFRVDYHGVSYRDHLSNAREADAEVATVDSYRLSTDVDAPDDLPEVLLHADGRASAWLSDRGFELVVDGGRVSAVRNNHGQKK